MKMHLLAATMLAGALAAGTALAQTDAPAQQPGAQLPADMLQQEQAAQPGATGAQGLDAMGAQGLQAQMTEDEIRILQQALADAGYDPGQIDGVWGPSTEQALSEYQQAQGLEASGQVDQQVIASLGLEDQIDTATATIEGAAPDVGVGDATTMEGETQMEGATGAEQPLEGEAPAQ